MAGYGDRPIPEPASGEEDVSAGGDRLVEAAGRLWEDARETLEEAATVLDLPGRLERNPYAVLAAAAGVGYLLGGGLFRPLASRLLGAGLRFAVIPILKDQLLVRPDGAGGSRPSSPGHSRARAGGPERASRAETHEASGGGEGKDWL